MGSINSEGIYEYDGTDSVTPIQTWGNLLSASVTSALAALRAEIDEASGSSGWQTLSVSSGWTVDEPLRCIKIGAIVYLQGVISSASSGVTQNVAFVPSGFSPTQAWRFPVYSSPAVTAERFTIQTSGAIQAPGNRTSKTYSIAEAWPVL